MKHKDYIMTEEPNIITEVLEDGTEIKIDLDLCNDVADQIMMKIFEAEDDETLKHYDVVATCFNMFINTYHVLLGAGWSKEELKQELEEHFVNHKNSMN